MTDHLEHALWPLAFLLVVLFVLHRMRETLDPIIQALVKGLAEKAQTDAGKWVVAGAFGLSASLSSFYDVFSQVTKADFFAMSGWQLAALFAKILNPFIVAFLASLMPPGAPVQKP